MITAEELIDHDDKSPVPYEYCKEIMLQFAAEAIKADRINLFKHVRLTEFAQEFLQEGASDAIDEDSIINAPMIELK